MAGLLSTGGGAATGLVTEAGEVVATASVFGAVVGTTAGEVWRIIHHLWFFCTWLNTGSFSQRLALQEIPACRNLWRKSMRRMRSNPKKNV